MSTSVASSFIAESWLEVARRSLASLRFGSVQIIVYEGRVTQVESREKIRFGTTSHDASDSPRASLKA